MQPYHASKSDGELSIGYVIRGSQRRSNVISPWMSLQLHVWPTAIRGQRLPLPGGWLWGLKPSPPDENSRCRSYCKERRLVTMSSHYHPFLSAATGTTLRLRQRLSKRTSNGNYRWCKLKKRQIRTRAPDNLELSFDGLRPLLVPAVQISGLYKILRPCV